MCSIPHAVSPDPSEEPESTFDVRSLRELFPVLGKQVHGKALVYLDNAATSQKPQVVIDTITRYYSGENSNIHRGVHWLSERATLKYEQARSKVRQFLNASSDREIIFVRSTTEAINLVAYSYGRSRIREGDEIIISEMEHHSNIVPWQILCEEKGAVLRVIPINDRGELLMDQYDKLLNARTKLVSITQISNALGTINPIRQIIEMAHLKNIPVLVDGAQATPHVQVDVRALDCDFYALSGHKLFGPTGIGVLYGKSSLLEEMPPFLGGGDMISNVTLEKTIYNELPYKFEAGTPNIAGGIGLGAAIDFLQGVGLDEIAEYEHELLLHATAAISDVPGVRLIGTARNKAAILTFVMDGVHPHDIGTILDQEGIAIRTGHHCAQPAMQRFKIDASARASFAFYNTKAEADALVEALYRVGEVFS